MDYNKTLNLPKTDFPMRANLPAREPALQQFWSENDIYNKMVETDKPLFVFHDGPPYANGDLHMGHAINKIIKDLIVKYRNMSGFKTPYIPGWDTHGLPIEQQTIKKLGVNRHGISPNEYRDVCRDFALGYVKNQMEQVKRMGTLADYDHPYLTLQPEFEARQIEVFGAMANKGYIYKGLKPVYWCADCETALAEAEIEYEDDKTESIYVKFQVKDGKGKFDGLENEINNGNMYFIIWTTTTWTLPGNMAICLNKEVDYSLVKAGGNHFIVAEQLVDKVFGEVKKLEKSQYETVKIFKGEDLEYITCQHPFLDRESIVILGDHVTTETGTGCVHTAPGHGIEDFDVSKKYDIEVVVPVDAKGHMNELSGDYNGMYYAKANKEILKTLENSGHLFAKEDILHSYPHCWRCKHPILFRATEQWFASIEGFISETLEAIKNVKWVPGWGEERMSSMVKDRNDWCISRQRLWGVPLPIFYCESCNKELITPDTIKAVSKLFGEKGSNAWYETEAKDILPEGTKCECGCDSFTMEKDIMDVWFDSGSSHYSVLGAREDQRSPADLYFEGNDQYRGWFQSSLLTSVAMSGEAPYKTVVVHGFVIDREGNKMSKSKGNGLSAMDIINKYGADILRLWTVSADFKTDIRIAEDILSQLSEIYRKIRNTARFILSNLYDFNPETDMVDFSKMPELDRYILLKNNKLVEKVLTSYESYEFHMFYHAIHNFCVIDLSNFYLDVIKDRLYAENAASLERRSAQTAMYIILDNLVRLLAPVLSFTMEEIWKFMPHRGTDDKLSVFVNSIPSYDKKYENSELEEKWDKILELKYEVSKALEIARAQKIIGHSLNACVKLYCSARQKEFLSPLVVELKTVFIVSDVELLDNDVNVLNDEKLYKTEIDGISVLVEPAKGEKCERCWMYSETVGQNSEHTTLCDRCSGIIEEK